MNPKKRDNYFAALQSLEEAIAEPIKIQRDIAGIIQNFEFVYELGWKYLKAYLEDEGLQSGAPKDVFTKAYQSDLIDDEEGWLDIMRSRNLTAHTYDPVFAKKLVDMIKSSYMEKFRSLKKLK